MKKEDKGLIIEHIGETLKEYAHFYLVDVTGMNAEATSNLRRKCFGANIKMLLVKNTLLHKALEAAEFDFSPLYGCLKGTTAVLFCDTANVPAKLIKEEGKSGVPALKAAYAEEGLYVGADQLIRSALSRARQKFLPKLLHCCNLLQRTLSLHSNLQARLSMAC